MLQARSRVSCVPALSAHAFSYLKRFTAMLHSESRRQQYTVTPHRSPCRREFTSVLLDNFKLAHGRQRPAACTLLLVLCGPQVSITTGTGSDTMLGTGASLYFIVMKMFGQNATSWPTSVSEGDSLMEPGSLTAVAGCQSLMCFQTFCQTPMSCNRSTTKDSDVLRSATTAAVLYLDQRVFPRCTRAHTHF